MEELLTLCADRLSVALGFVTLLMLAVGSALALWRLASGAFSGRSPVAVTLEVWQALSRWLVLALQFLIAADLAETVVRPTWDVLGRLAVVALLRTVLGYFLSKDVEAARRIAEEESARALAATPTGR